MKTWWEIVSVPKLPGAKKYRPLEDRRASFNQLRLLGLAGKQFKTEAAARRAFNRLSPDLRAVCSVEETTHFGID